MGKVKAHRLARRLAVPPLQRHQDALVLGQRRAPVLGQADAPAEVVEDRRVAALPELVDHRHHHAVARRRRDPGVELAAAALKSGPSARSSRIRTSVAAIASRSAGSALVAAARAISGSSSLRAATNSNGLGPTSGRTSGWAFPAGAPRT
jgi:hypothetical protein